MLMKLLNKSMSLKTFIEWYRCSKDVLNCTQTFKDKQEIKRLQTAIYGQPPQPKN